MATSIIRVLILCKTYPSPSAKYSETSCVAGLTEPGDLIRLFPVPFRLITDEQQFRKWQWIDVRVEKSRDDHRPESHRIFIDTIRATTEPMQAGKSGWPLRMELLERTPQFECFTAMDSARESSGLSLAFLRPKRVLQLEIKPTKEADWSEDERRKLSQWQLQDGLFDDAASARNLRLLEKLPFDCYYHCEFGSGETAYTRRIKLVDWEVGALYRNLRRQYGPAGWEIPFREMYEKNLPARDLRLMMGTVHRFPDQWLGISVIAPPSTQQPSESSQGLLF